MADRYRLDQLDEEVRVALGLSSPLGLSWNGSTYPTPASDPAGGWTQAALDKFKSTCDAHVPNPLWHELQDERVIRLILTDNDFDAALAATAGTLTATQRDVLLQKLIKATRALARIARNQAQ